MFETLIFFIILLFINLIFAYKPLPIMSFPIGLFSIYIGSTVFLSDTTLPTQPYLTIFLILICLANILLNAFSLKEK